MFNRCSTCKRLYILKSSAFLCESSHQKFSDVLKGREIEFYQKLAKELVHMDTLAKRSEEERKRRNRNSNTSNSRPDNSYIYSGYDDSSSYSSSDSGSCDSSSSSSSCD